MLALQSEEDYKISARHFKAFNDTGETELISQLSSPNNIARNRAAQILGELKSATAFPILRQQFDGYLQDKKLPDSGIVIALMYYDQNPIDQIIAELGTKNFKINRKEDWEIFPDRFSKEISKHLEEILLKEEDADRARFMIYLLNLSAFRTYSSQILERIQKEHPVIEIRELVPHQTYRHIRFH
jgi:hypothetical protein